MQQTFFPTPAGLQPTPAPKRGHKPKVADLLSQARKLADDLNAALYTCAASERPVIHSPADGVEIIRPFLKNLDHEELWVINLNTRNRVLSLTKLYQGSVNSSQIRIGEVFRQAISANAPAIIIAHNHPSGDCTASPDDVAVTRSIVQGGKLLDIDVLDHLIIGSELRFTSLKEKGLGFA